MDRTTSIYWQMAEQTGRIVGKELKDGTIVRNDLMDWADRKYHRTNKDGKLAGYLTEEPKNPELTSEPTKKELSNKNYKEAVKNYADEWRNALKENSKPTGIRGIR